MSKTYAWLCSKQLREKLGVTRQPGARFSSVCFVAGKLDPLSTLAEFLDLARRSSVPPLTVYRAQTPSRSRAEMESFGSMPTIRSVASPHGKLSIHEEFPDLAVEAINPFLSDRSTMEVPLCGATRRFSSRSLELEWAFIS
jgi:hypothetical protein